MKENLQEILPGKGLGPLKFGMSREEVESLLGKPDEKEIISEDEDDLSEAWHYDALDLSLGFEEVQYWELVTISVTSESYQLEGHSLVGLERSELLVLMDELELESPESEGESMIDNVLHEIVSSNEIGIDFWLEDGVVSEVQLGPFWNDDDMIEWPE